MFIGYLKKSKGYTFYCPNHNPRIVETNNAKLLENSEVSGSNKQWNVDIKEVKFNIPSSSVVPKVIPVAEECHNNAKQQNETSLEETNS